ncbi:DNA repair protein endonuclease SAE2/CtIP C-terminus-domain-containing protein [Collybia nuda]|uniref:DNA repair protein endonuclease SAE2/CtIP C-terminus-domain-containing protein n=1 Tax=Collybia nuda TaxID=64659 RepID=A0A9P5XZB3_9AGAR|nr:DNA repair protein endonuclease SAE2/CtIP C-terminus-domain-containing protein [Collybia nuda]
MESTKASYSSVHLRERDKILEEKHKKDLAIVERKIDKLKWSNNDVLKQLFEMQTRANRLAQNLGFYDIYEAQVYVDNADYEMPYKECFESISVLKGELSAEKRENEQLQERLRLAEEERDQLKAAAATTNHKQKAALAKYKSLSETLSDQVEQLQLRYDALVEVKERAAARYKLDYNKWKKVRDWMFSEKADDAGKKLPEKERKQHELTQVKKKKELLLELGLESVLPEATGDEPSDPPLIPIMDCESNKENQATPTASGTKQRLTEPPSLVSHPLPLSPTMVEPAKKSSTPASTALQNLQANKGSYPAPSCSPSIFFDAPATSTRTPLMFRPVLHVAPPIKQEAGSSPILSSNRPLKRQHLDGHAASSDTEDDSQAVGLFPAPTAGFKAPEPPSTIRRRFPVPAGSSDTEAESQSQAFFNSTPSGAPTRPKQPSTVPAPSKKAIPQPNILRRSDVGVVSRDAETLQPLKMRRLSDNGFLEQALSSTTHGHTVQTAAQLTSRSMGKRKAVEPPASTPKAPTTGQARINDYSAFKGRGRYAKDSGSANRSINATYVIDPSRNGGLDFQYEEVVRKKDDRKKMDAGDCECCREYYEAVGPLPNRLHAPLWRSPVNSPTKPCPQHQHDHASGSRNVASENRHSEIGSHKQAISRHRHHWARASTPPGYWNIGFPDTQEAENINEQAREMHTRKRAEVEDAVKRGDSRYKKR